MFDLLMLMAHEQSYVTVMLNLLKAIVQTRLQCSICPQSFFRTHSRPRHHSLKLLSMKRR